MKTIPGVVVWLAAMLFQSVQSARADDWPQFLGPERNGRSAETGLLDRWPDQGPKVVWRAEGGVGMSALAIRGERAFTLVQRDKKQWVVSLSSQTGELIWKTPIAAEYRNPMGN